MPPVLSEDSACPDCEAVSLIANEASDLLTEQKTDGLAVLRERVDVKYRNSKDNNVWIDTHLRYDNYRELHTSLKLVVQVLRNIDKIANVSLRAISSLSIIRMYDEKNALRELTDLHRNISRKKDSAEKALLIVEEYIDELTILDLIDGDDHV